MIRGSHRGGARAIARAGAQAVALLGALAVGSSARAEGVGVIAARGDDRAAVAAALAAAIGPGRVVDDAVGEAQGELAAGAVPAAAMARFRRAREMIDDGWRAFLRVQIDAAHSRLAAARAEAEPLMALPGGAELYADATLRLGAVLLYRKSDEAPGLLALALAIDPARPITLAEFSPDVVDAVDAVRAAPAGAPVRLQIDAQPREAVLSLDGAAAVPAPLVAQVALRPHVVVGRAPGYRARVMSFGGEPSRDGVTVALELDDRAAALAVGAEPGLPAAAEQGLVDAALVYADLDEAVLAAVDHRAAGPTLIVQRCAGAPARCTAAVEVGYADRAGLAAAVRDAWQTVKRGELREPPSVIGVVHRGAAPPARCELCRSPLVWTGVGAVVVGAIVAIVAASSSRPPPVLTVHGGDFGR